MKYSFDSQTKKKRKLTRLDACMDTVMLNTEGFGQSCSFKVLSKRKSRATLKRLVSCTNTRLTLETTKVWFTNKTSYLSN